MCTFCMGLSSGKLTQLWKIMIFHGKSPHKLQFSMAVLTSCKGYQGNITRQKRVPSKSRMYVVTTLDPGSRFGSKERAKAKELIL